MADNIAVRVAQQTDLASLKGLHRRYQLNTIVASDMGDGFVTTDFTDEQWRHLITVEKTVLLAIHNNRVIGYAIAASWQFYQAWPVFAHMIKHLPHKQCNNTTLSTINSCQYGPICVDKPYRGRGVFQQLFNAILTHLSNRYPFVVTFINKRNQRSYRAHKNKTILRVISEFEFQGQHFYELACNTRVKNTEEPIAPRQ